MLWDKNEDLTKKKKKKRKPDSNYNSVLQFCLLTKHKLFIHEKIDHRSGSFPRVLKKKKERKKERKKKTMKKGVNTLTRSK